MDHTFVFRLSLLNRIVSLGQVQDHERARLGNGLRADGRRSSFLPLAMGRFGLCNTADRIQINKVQVQVPTPYFRPVYVVTRVIDLPLSF